MEVTIVICVVAAAVVWSWWAFRRWSRRSAAGTGRACCGNCASCSSKQ
jgi:hypothetical protein